MGGHCGGLFGEIKTKFAPLTLFLHPEIRIQQLTFVYIKLGRRKCHQHFASPGVSGGDGFNW
jgi:hypothetical protein